MTGNLPAAVSALYLTRSEHGSQLLCLLAERSDSFATTAASFAFSMLGFMAAVMALFSVLGQSRAFKEYRRSGYLRVLLIAMAVAMLELSIAFATSLTLFFGAPSPGELGIAFVAMVAGGGMVLLTVVPMIGLQIQAAKEPE